jgi:hypothetical protein
MNCRPGDPAIVIRADFRSNVGYIVHVIERHDGQGEQAFTDRGPV